MRAWFSRIGARLRAAGDALWHSTLANLHFLHGLSAEDIRRLRNLASLFLDRKEFSGAQGLVVTDTHAVAVAVQACMPILHIAPPDRPDLALRWYDGFVGIVLHASGVRAHRVETDDAGVVHSWQEDLTGETVQGGPLMLAWSDVAAAGATASESYNVVVHEFIHVMDMQDGMPDGCPPMSAEARRAWLSTVKAQYDAFCEQVQQWERFGGLAIGPQGASRAQHAPLIDSYGTESIDEFFAVAAEAYFVRGVDFAEAYPELLALFDRFFVCRA